MRNYQNKDQKFSKQKKNAGDTKYKSNLKSNKMEATTPP